MKKKSLTKVCGLTIVAFGTAMLAACSGQNSPEKGASANQNQLVECYGVAKDSPDGVLLMTKGMCDKLPSTKQVVVTSKDYVECYGVAAAGQNGCATKANSCGGFVKVDRAPDAWVSLPLGVCQNLKGASVGHQAKGDNDSKDATK